MLVVEADGRRRRELARALRMPGVEVLEAAHGPGALWALRARGADAAVVPAGAGPELLAGLRREAPGLRLILVGGAAAAGPAGAVLPEDPGSVRCDGSRASVRAALRSVLDGTGADDLAARELRLHRELDLADEVVEVLRALGRAFGAPERVGELLFLDDPQESVHRLHRGAFHRGAVPLRGLSGSDFARLGEARAATRPRLRREPAGGAVLLLPLRRRGELAGAVVVRLAADPGEPRALLELAEHAGPAAAAALARLRTDAELRAERGRWAAVLDAVADPVLVVDAHHRLVAANAAALEVAGPAASAGASRPCFELCTPSGGGPPEGCPLAATVRDGRPRRRELEGLFGRRGRRYAVASFPLEGRHEGAVVHVYRDVTRVRDLPERLRRAEKLGPGGHLAAAVAHEIRNPLAAMTNAVSLLRDQGDLAPEDARLMDIVLEESQRVSRIVGDFLSYARPLRLERVSGELGEWVETTAELLRRDPRVSAELDLECRVEGPLPELDLDRDKLRQLVWNLLVNAVEACGARGRIRVRVRTDSGAAGARIEVEDDGPGIPPGERARIFEPFETGKEGGTGLGLPISRHIAELHGGGISIEDSELGGARLVVFLPAAEPLD